MESWVTKVLALGLLLLFTLLFGLAPIQVISRLKKARQAGRSLTRSKVEFCLSLLNCFAGGVFLGTTLLHMMPEVREDMEDVLKAYGTKTDFAVAEFVIAGGFFMIMVVENVVMVMQHHQTGGGGMESEESSVCCDNSQEERLIKKDRGMQRSYGSIGDVGQFDNYSANLSHENPQLSSSQKIKAQVEEGASGGNGQGHQQGSKGPEDSHASSSHDSHYHHHNHHQHHDHHGHHHHHKHHLVVEISPEGEHHHHQDTQHHPEGRQFEGNGCESMHPPIKVERGDCVHVIHPSHHEHHHMEVQQLASLRSFLLLLALSLHTVFEGLAIGLQPTNQAVWNLFIAIVVHKCIIAFSMGIQFAETLTTFRRATIFIVFFSLMSPIGVAIGTGVFEIQGSSSGSALASVILQAIAAGTFLYVTFFEVLNKEVGQDHSLLKVLFIILGFGAMVLLNLFNHEPKN